MAKTIKAGSLWRVVTHNNTDGGVNEGDDLYPDEASARAVAEALNARTRKQARHDYVAQSLVDAVREYGDTRAYGRNRASSAMDEG